MLGLQLPTDPRWAKIAEKNIEQVLVDHAWCEQKALSNAISLITLNPDKEDLVSELMIVAQEELEHFKMVHDKIKERGFSLGREEKDDYVNELLKFAKKGGSRQEQLIERLLFAAMIEARSCERFKVLTENINDQELVEFYRELMISEANHYTLFLKFARKYGEGLDVDKRWSEWLKEEARIISSYGKEEKIHG